MPNSPAADLSRTPLTGEASTIHKPLGKPGGPGLFHHKGLQLPAYIQSVAQHLRGEHGESKAIEMAVGIVKNWAAGHDGHGNRVHPDVQAAAAKAVAQWEKDRTEGKASRAMANPASTGTMNPAQQTNLDGPGWDDDYDPADYDADGLNSTWDGDHSDLPDLGGIGVDQMEQAEKSLPGWDGRVHGQHQSVRAMPKLGTGARFAHLKSSLAAKGASDPGALAAYIGRRKFGKKAFTKLAAHAKGGGAASRSAVGRGEIMRFCEVEEMRIVSRAQGDGTGRLVEAYATPFDQETEIHDGQGHYKETIDRQAFNDVLSRIGGKLGSAVRVLYNHGKTQEGVPAPEFQKPIGKPVEIRPDGRGLLTRTEYAKTPLGEEVLELIRAGAITTQSFVGPIIRSDPDLRGPGDRYRARNGALQLVRRTVLGLREYGPVLWAAYPGAEILGVRMQQLPGSDLSVPVYTDDEEDASANEVVTAGVREDTTSESFHLHALYALRSREAREAAGIGFD